ncbi:MAG TPA: STAS domain-containing protein [Candidatus Polarisedimenticolaceae bacterium]|nr:STAS domain-containing protein [Candidatus Polarisedimenticolaceae bacterium]
MLEIKFGPEGEVIMAGRFDASQAEMAETFLSGVKESRVVDLKDLSYISSLGLGVLLSAQKRLMGAGHSLRLVNVRGHVREIFHFSGFEQVFEIDPAPPA